MNYLKVAAVIILLFLGGCSYYHSNMSPDDPRLNPRVLKGSFSEVQSVAYKAAQRAFPYELEKIKIEAVNKICVYREWVWRGDTLVTIIIEEQDKNEYIINVESKSSWHKGNATSLNLCEEEVAEYFSALDQEYELFQRNGKSPGSKHPEGKSMKNKLKELKEALDSGLISEKEFHAKRKEMIKGL